MANNSVIIEGSSWCRNVEADAGAAITPGHLLSMDSNGDYVVHATADGPNTYLFADLSVDPDDDKDDAYASGERVRAQQVMPGVVVDALVGESQTIAPGDFLVSDGDGTLVERGAEAYGVVIGYARESVTTGSAEEARCEVVVI